MAPEGFFDFRDRLLRPPPPDPAATTQSQPLSISQLTAKIDSAIRGGVPGNLLVRGELSNFNPHRGSGHMYFTLKDAAACIDCVMFRGEAKRLKFTPVDGGEVLATGSVRVFAQRGRYQLYVTSLAPLGKGALELAFQQLKEKLEREGLFAAARKRPIPKFPRTIAIITGRETAALQDILKVLRRFPFLDVMIYPVLVQGEGAAGQIVDAIQTVARLGRLPSPTPDRSIGPPVAARRPPQLIVLSRGGGSLEDLWAFNEEVVARAIAASPIPIITGIGHEVDVSIADLVADHHAHTPTEAAQVVIANWRTAGTTIEALAARHSRAVLHRVSESRQRLRLIQQHELFRRPTDIVDRRRERLDDLQRSLVAALRHRQALASEELQSLVTAFARQHPRHALRLLRQKLTQLTLALPASAKRSINRRSQAVLTVETHLKAISPQSTLGRGYSITSRKGGSVIRTAAEVKTGDVLLTRFADGQAESVVRDQRQMRLFE